MSERKFSGRRAVVTGAASGLGRAIALELAARKARLVVADLNLAGVEKTAAEIRQGGGEALAFECDVTRPERVEALAAFTDEKLGGVDVVVNNAGVAVGGEVGEVPLQDWKFVVDVNLWGVIYGCHAFVPRLRRQKSGFVLNVASAAGLISAPGLGPYNVTKAAVVALSETLAGEVRDDGVLVSVLCPTFFKTGILEASRGSDDAQREVVRQRMEGSRVQAPDVARAALDGLERGKLYIVPMWDGRIIWWLKRLSPALFVFLARRLRARLEGR